MFWERATGQGGQPLDLDFFELALSLYAGDVTPATIFERGELALDAGELVELSELLALMPAGDTARAPWVRRVHAVLLGARLGFSELDDITKAKAALGL